MNDSTVINSLVIKEGALIKAYKLNRFLSIPYGISVLKHECLYNQTALEEIIMADSVTRIENNAFEGCMNLTSILLSKNIEYIGRSAFSDCASLGVLTLPSELAEVDFGAFNGCKRLGKLTMNKKLKKVGGAAFIHSGINTVYYEGNLEDWLDVEFSNSTSNPLNRGADLYIDGEIVKDLVIPSNISEIGRYAFFGCKSMRSLELREGVERIGSYAFSKCTKLKRVRIPKSVTHLGRGVFSGCPPLSINLSESLFESIRVKKCPVCQNKLPFFETQCQYCSTEFKVYED